MSTIRSMRWLCGVALASSALAVAACGSSSSTGSASTSSTTSAATSAASSASTGSVVAEARHIVQIAAGKLVYSRLPAPVLASDIEPYGTWQGPTTAPAHKSGLRIEVVTCSAQVADCVSVASGVQAAAAALGWKVDVVNPATPDPTGWAQAFNTALSRNPAAIITVAITGQTIQAAIATAKSQGIPVIGAVAETPAGGYAAIVSSRQPFEEALLGQWTIADSSGKAQVVGMTNTDSSTVAAAMAAYQKTLSVCSGCSVTLKKWTVDQTVDPTQYNAVVSALLHAHPSADYLALPYTLDIQNAYQVLRQLGRQSTVKVLNKDADHIGLQGVLAGNIAADAGSPSLLWLGWASVDQAVRLLAKQPALTIGQQGIPVTLFTKTTTPASANAEDVPSLPNYAARYKTAWGIK